MRARNMAFAFAATALIALSSAFSSAQQQETAEARARAALVGKAAPSLNVGKWVNTDGKALSLEDLKGKVVVLDFFTYW